MKIITFCSSCVVNKPLRMESTEIFQWLKSLKWGEWPSLIKSREFIEIKQKYCLKTRLMGRYINLGYTRVQTRSIIEVSLCLCHWIYAWMIQVPKAKSVLHKKLKKKNDIFSSFPPCNQYLRASPLGILKMHYQSKVWLKNPAGNNK